MVAQGAQLEKAPSHKVEVARRPNGASYFKRLATAWNSFRVLRDLTPEQVEHFMQSYVIYDLDWADEKQMIETLGPDYQKRVGECLADYYSVLNHLCALGELEKMYIPPIMDANVGIADNQILYEESIAQDLHLPPNATVLDLGCGRGRVAAHIASMTGARVTGINIDADQINSAINFNREKNFGNEFIRRDFNDLPLPLPDNHFDGFYQIQAFSLCKDISKLCRELYRLLKPGSRLVLLDWVSLPAFNKDDPHHQDLMRAIKPLIGAVGTPTPQSMVDALESAGFKCIKHDNPSKDGLQAPLLEVAKTYFATAKWALYSLVSIGLLPAHFKTLFDRFSKDSDAFIEADRLKLITTCYHWVAEKPRESATTDQSTAATNGEATPLATPDAAVPATGSTTSSRAPVEVQA
ncbi:S-adenosyl-L-methionine-dependent methyltransferase [Teratosphaeria nubilosa]|uniref:S-adenosyl-L-methionine-dependent methyltransferase n=1 Tax=Teratosphaeria nubilosa TaxID=161662 RepID=A0A6G1LFU5_9PEZI|nr:S-adenosyl-L-methionine-dependent methyltransferase [Teratosphaeria nubilosa]